MMQSIADGMTTIDETFPPLEQQNPDAKPANDPAPSALDRFAEEPSQTARGPARDDADERGAADQANSRVPAAAPGDEAVRAAYERGKQHRAAGHQRKAMPGEYRDAAHTREAWYAGFDGQPMPETKAEQ
jgi:hypothetical protein